MSHFLSPFLLALSVIPHPSFVSVSPPVYVPVFVYHHVKPNPNNFIAISPDMFEQHLKYLSEEGYHSITATDYLLLRRGEKDLPSKPVMLTFDDGNRNAFVYAVPLMRKYEATATFFVYPGVIEHPEGKKFLSVSDLTSLHEMGFDIQSHSWSHPLLPRLVRGTSENFPRKLRRELVDSKEWLEKKLNKKVESFAIPFGAYNRSLFLWLEKAGYKAAYTIDNGFNTPDTPVMKLKRWQVLKKQSFRSFVKKLQSVPP